MNRSGVPSGARSRTRGTFTGTALSLNLALGQMTVTDQTVAASPIGLIRMSGEKRAQRVLPHHWGGGWVARKGDVVVEGAGRQVVGWTPP